MKIVLLTGAGMSAESGISTFRSSDGLWENHRVEDVADIEGYLRNPGLVLDFYNMLRRGLRTRQPNPGHRLIARWEQFHEVVVVTQNVDDLHERAGSTRIIHLHGELTRACDETKTLVEDIGYDDIHLGDRLGGTQKRPFIVWFGEAVPLMDEAIAAVRTADVVVVVGTSLKVYPAAGLLAYAPRDARLFLVDPSPAATDRPVEIIALGASEGLVEVSRRLGIPVNPD